MGCQGCSMPEISALLRHGEANSSSTNALFSYPDSVLAKFNASKNMCMDHGRGEMTQGDGEGSPEPSEKPQARDILTSCC